MEFNIEVRKRQLQSLDQYITSSKDKVQSILEYLGWNSKTVLEKKPNVTCSVNPNHRILLKSTEEHLKKCYIKTAGYNADEKFLSEPLHSPTSSVILDSQKKTEILGQARYSNQRFKAAWNGQDPDPMTSDRYFSTYSSDERLTLYDYCVKHSKHPPTPSEFDIHIDIDNKKEEKLLTQEERLAKERDAKRRRIKYKSVHTSCSKSHTEVIKEVIENQMEMYREYLASKMGKNMYSTCINEDYDQSIQQSDDINNKSIQCKKDLEDVDRPHSSISRHSTHSNSSRSKNHYDHRKEYHKNGDDHKRKSKEYDRKHRCDDNSSHKQKRRGYKDYRPHSRDKRERNYKSDGRRH